VKVAGLRLAIFDVSPFLAVRMYRSLGAIWEGFTKNSFAVFGANWFAMLAGLAVLWSMLLLPWVWFVFGPSWGWSATASTALPLIQIASIVVARVMSDRLGGRPDLLATLLIPLSCLTATAICLHAGLRSLFGRPTRWRGRAYSAVDG
jgi:hypothetical protein